MASMEIMREYVSRQYRGSWPMRVKAMPDAQVACIYNRMIDELDNLKKTSIPPRIRETEVSGGDQLSFFDNEWSTKIKEGYLNGESDEAPCKDNNQGGKDSGSC